MNELNPHLDLELDVLYAAARARCLGTSATQYTFETRLLARLRAACMVALTLSHEDVVSETNEAEQIAYVENPDAQDAWTNLN